MVNQSTLSGASPEAVLPLLSQQWPVLAGQLRDALTAANEPALAGQVDALAVHARCECADEWCQSILTTPGPEGAYGDGYRCVSLNPGPWLLTLDVVHEQVVYVEILHRDPLS